MRLGGSGEDGRWRGQEPTRLVGFFSAVAADLSSPLGAGARVLDFGCGEGEEVEAWRTAGYEAYGCDIVLERHGEWLSLIEQPYRLPFEDASFDLVVSNQVLEHVQDHDAAFREISRVLKPGATSLHLFPARWMPIEVHSHVPLATVVQQRWWLGCWARLGIRNEFQNDLTWHQVADMNLEYLRTRTNYLTRRQLIAAGDRWFDEVRLVEELGLKHGRRTQRVYPLVKIAPPLAWMYSELRSRLLFLRTHGS